MKVDSASPFGDKILIDHHFVLTCILSYTGKKGEQTIFLHKIPFSGSPSSDAKQTIPVNGMGPTPVPCIFTILFKSFDIES